MNRRHVILVAGYSARYSVRSGIGLLFLLLSLTFGLLVAHLTLQSVEQGALLMMLRDGNEQDSQRARERALEELTKQAKPIVSWMLAPKSTRVDPDDAQAASEWASFLLDQRPAILSAIFLILLFGWPLVVSFGAFDLYSGDIGSRQLRYQLLRADRGSIYVGRLVGMLLTFVAVLVVLGTIVTGYLGLKLDVYSWSALIGWGFYGTAALVCVSLPYVALCAWVSAGFGSSFASLTIASLVIGGVPLFAMFGRMTHEAAGYVNYLLPWGFQTHLLHHEPAKVALAVGGCLLQTTLFTWLGYRKFTTRDL